MSFYGQTLQEIGRGYGALQINGENLPYSIDRTLNIVLGSGLTMRPYVTDDNLNRDNLEFSVKFEEFKVEDEQILSADGPIEVSHLDPSPSGVLTNVFKKLKLPSNLLYQADLQWNKL